MIPEALIAVEIPFDKRNCCWFCGEPSAKAFVFPKKVNKLETCCHPQLSVPSCNECTIGAKQSKHTSIWLIANDVKTYLIKKYKKHLAIGVNWTKEALAESEFEGGNFELFQRSAWLMFEIARDRVNYLPWPLVVDGVNIEHLRQDDYAHFTFDGIDFPSLTDAIDHYVEIFTLNEDFLRQALSKLGIAQFSYAIRLSRLMVGVSAYDRRQALKDL